MGLFLNVMVLVFALLMGYLSLFQTIIIRDENGKFLKITRAGKFLIAALFLALGFGIWKAFYDEASNNKNSNTISKMNNQISELVKKLDNQDKNYRRLEDQYDSLKAYNIELKAQLRALQNEGNANTEKILHNHPVVVDKPDLELCPLIFENRQNPNTAIISNKIVCHISICNTGNSSARNLVDRYVAVNYINNKPSLDFSDTSIINKSMVINPDEPGVILSPGLSSKNGSLSSLSADPNVKSFFYFKLSYTNKKGIPQQPLRKIFAIKANRVLETINMDYDRVSKDLKTYNLW